MRWMVACVLAASIPAAAAGAQELEPPRLADGAIAMPALPAPMVVGWGEVFLEVAAGADGRVTGVRELRTAAPFGDLVRRAVEQWHFEPARTGEETVESHVLVAAVYRPRVLHNTPTVGTAPVDVAPPSAAIPYPVAGPPPMHPPTAIGDAVIVVEVTIGQTGDVTGAEVVSGPSGYDASALQAARQWRFDRPRAAGAPDDVYAYLVFGFREPVVAH